MAEQEANFDVIVIGGGPAGSVLASLLAQRGNRCLVLERDIHPRDHVGESLTPSTNPIFARIGFLEKMEDAGFVHKPGACWTAPRSPVGKFVAIRLGEFPPPDATQLYTYNVEREVFDAMLIRHAHELGAKVLQGVTVQKVLFDGDRAVGVRAKFADGWHRDLFAGMIVDASGRRCLLANQLSLKRKDPHFNQFGIYSWFKGVEPNPPGYEGFLFLHFLGLERAWAWQIPMRNGVCSVGVVTDKADFKRSGSTHDEFFESLVARNRTLAHNMRAAERTRPWWMEGDYSYKVDRLAGNGWLMVGDALRFVDPIFSTGVDVASYSAAHAFDALDRILRGEDEGPALQEYERRVSDGVEAWYDLIALFYKLQNLFTFFAVKRDYREKVVRILQGNLYMPESLQRAREMISVMEETYDRVMDQPANLLRPGALGPQGGSAMPQTVVPTVAEARKNGLGLGLNKTGHTADDWDRKWARADFAPEWRIRSVPPELRQATDEEWFPPGGSVLDIGCGSGEIARWLAEQGYEVTGIDFSRAAIERATGADRGVARVTFEVLDICEEAPRKAGFDALLDRGCVHTIGEGRRHDYVRNLHTAARPGARFLLLVPNPPGRRDEWVGHLKRLLSPAFDIIRVTDTRFERSSGESAEPFQRGVALWMIRG